MEADTLNVMIALLAIFISIVGLLTQHFTSIARLKERIATIEVKIEPFWKLVEQQLPLLLKQHSAFRKDELLDKMSIGGLVLPEAKELDNILEYELKERTMPDRTLIYVMVLGRLKQVIFEMENHGFGRR
jgi:hypothetical protein